MHCCDASDIMLSTACSVVMAAAWWWINSMEGAGFASFWMVLVWEQQGETACMQAAIWYSTQAVILTVYQPVAA